MMPVSISPTPAERQVPDHREPHLAPLGGEAHQAAIAAKGVNALCGVLRVEQNAPAAPQIADRAYVMELGEFILSGPASEVAADARVAASYLGFADSQN